MTVNGLSLGCGQDETFEDLKAFFTILWFIYQTNGKKSIYRLIENENILYLQLYLWVTRMEIHFRWEFFKNNNELKPVLLPPSV